MNLSTKIDLNLIYKKNIETNPERKRPKRPRGYWKEYGDNIINQLCGDLDGDEILDWAFITRHRCIGAKRFFAAVLNANGVDRKLKASRVRFKILGHQKMVESLSIRTGIPEKYLFLKTGDMYE